LQNKRARSGGQKPLVKNGARPAKPRRAGLNFNIIIL
jgi:hypothetical protein